MLRPIVRGLGWPPDMWRDMGRMQREMNRLFPGITLPSSGGYPALNVWSSGDDVIVTAELPGITPEKLDIAVEGDMLSISGSRALPELKEGEAYHRQERSHGRFKRLVQLPFRADTGKIAATYERGVLCISIPRIEEDKPKKIEIRGE